jgi:type II secretory pathway component PulK
MKRAYSQSGMILVVAAWAMVILTVLALSLSHRVRAEISRSKYAAAQWQAQKAVWQGVRYALEVIDQEVKSSKSNGAGQGLGNRPEFKSIKSGEKEFSIFYMPDGPGAEVSRQYGVADEERKININTLPTGEYRVLEFLLAELGVDSSRARTIAAAVLDWRDADSEVFASPFGAEDDFYRTQSRPYRCKNSFFESVEELLLVRGIDAGVFSKLRNYVTVYPPEGRFAVDLTVAPGPVLRALARSFTGARTNTDLVDADSLTEKILRHRGPGQDGRLPDADTLGLNSRERVIFVALGAYQQEAAETFAFVVEGWDRASGTKTAVGVVVSQPQLKILRWKRL